MADTYTPNLNLTKPEVGASRDTWGGKTNEDWDKVDAVFAGAGNGTSVGLNVGAGKTLSVAGTLSASGTVSLPAAATAGGATIVSTTGTQTLTNKTLTNPAINGFTGDTSIINIGSGQIYKDTSGNVGIGVSTPTSRLTVRGSGSSLEINQDVGSVRFSSSPNRTNNWYLGANISDSVNAGFIIGSGADIPTGTARLAINGAGAVGIGTATMPTKLTIADPGEAGTRYLGNGLTSAGLFVGYNSAAYVYNDSNTPMIFGTNGSERMRITSAGNVGIGTSSPAGRLHSFSSTYSPSTSAWVSGASFVGSGAFGGGISLVDGAAGYSMFVQDAGGTFIIGQGATSGALSTRMLIDAGGNVGIGTSSPTERLHVSGRVRAEVGSGSDEAVIAEVTGFSNSPGIALRRLGTNMGKIDADYFQGMRFYVTNGSGAAATERARITAGGDFLINSTGASGTGRLVVRGVNSTVNNCVSFLNNAGDQELNILTGFELTNGTPQGVAASTVMTLRSSGAAAGVIAFATGNTERARIDSSGNTYFGSNRAYATGAVTRIYGDSVSGYARIDLNKFSSGTFATIGFYHRNNTVGSIDTTDTGTIYATSSDYRLKENVTPLTGAAARVQALKPSRFNFIADPARVVDGFIAHEAAEVVPEAVSGEKDAVNEDGSIKAQGIDQSRLVPLLTAALQEALTEIASLKARVAALETK